MLHWSPFGGTALKPCCRRPGRLFKPNGASRQLPGGGGTPLAAGLQTAITLAEQAKGRGMTPTLCLLTDGRANIALDGSADRRKAAEDAQKLARKAQADGLGALVIDMSKRPQTGLRALLLIPWQRPMFPCPVPMPNGLAKRSPARLPNSEG